MASDLSEIVKQKRGSARASRSPIFMPACTATLGWTMPRSTPPKGATTGRCSTQAMTCPSSTHEPMGTGGERSRRMASAAPVRRGGPPPLLAACCPAPAAPATTPAPDRGRGWSRPPRGSLAPPRTLAPTPPPAARRRCVVPLLTLAMMASTSTGGCSSARQAAAGSISTGIMLRRPGRAPRPRCQPAARGFPPSPWSRR
jgi:hypothetical protein